MNAESLTSELKLPVQRRENTIQLPQDRIGYIALAGVHIRHADVLSVLWDAMTSAMDKHGTTIGSL